MEQNLTKMLEALSKEFEMVGASAKEAADQLQELSNVMPEEKRKKYPQRVRDFMKKKRKHQKKARKANW